MSASSLRLLSRSPDETCRLARVLADRLRAGDTILLDGDIGAGKTHFARCLIQTRLDMPEDIPSPTYTLVQTYPARACAIWHADLYRLSDVQEIEELGLTEAFEDAICLIEWPDRLGGMAPPDALTIRFEAAKDDAERRITLSWAVRKWDAMVKGLEHAGS